uniref:Opsin-5 n=2 Tax=Callorhinchus milii TaxID=7868 RepID=A0A4W3IAF8_CALMI
MTAFDNSTALYSGYWLHDSLHGDPFVSKLSWEADIISACYLIVTGLLSTLGNGYVIYLSITQKRKLKPPEILITNLAISDFGMSVGGQPFLIISCFSHRWIFGWVGCRWHGWAGFFFGCGSLITMTVVSLDRYLKICHLQYGSWLQRRHVFMSLAFIWFYAAFWATMPLVGWGNYAPEPFGTSCTLDWWLARVSVSGLIFVLTILFFCLLLPIIIIVFSYIKIIAKVKSSAKEVAHFDSRIQNHHSLEMNLTKMAIFICGGFMFAWIPYAVASVWSAFGSPNSVPIEVSVIPTMLAKSAAMYNPIIYQIIDCRCVSLSRITMICDFFRSARQKTTFRKPR